MPTTRRGEWSASPATRGRSACDTTPPGDGRGWSAPTASPAATATTPATGLPEWSTAPQAEPCWPPSSPETPPAAPVPRHDPPWRARAHLTGPGTAAKWGGSAWSTTAPPAWCASSPRARRRWRIPSGPTAGARAAATPAGRSTTSSTSEPSRGIWPGVASCAKAIARGWPCGNTSTYQKTPCRWPGRRTGGPPSPWTTAPGRYACSTDSAGNVLARSDAPPGQPASRPRLPGLTAPPRPGERPPLLARPALGRGRDPAGGPRRAGDRSAGRGSGQPPHGMAHNSHPLPIP